MRLANRDHVRLRNVGTFMQYAQHRILRNWSIDYRADRLSNETRQRSAGDSRLRRTRIHQWTRKIFFRQHEYLTVIVDPRQDVDGLIRTLDQFPYLTRLFVTIR